MTKEILYIDDDKNIESDCISLKILIEKEIEHVLKFTIRDNPFGAIETLKENIFDAIICDGHLVHRTHGREVIAFIKENQPNQLSKVIVHSSDSYFVDECKEQDIRGCVKSLYSFDPIVNELLALLKDKTI